MRIEKLLIIPYDIHKQYCAALMMINNAPPKASAWLIWTLASGFFLIEYLVRISPSIISNALMRNFSVQAFALGGLSAFFYYAYASMQIPAGLIVDRFGSYKPLIMATLCCALGSWLFAEAPSISIGYVSRFIIGFGAAFAFVCTMKIIATWFPKPYFPLLAGITQALGMVGAAIGDAPLSLLFHHFGWRETMLVISGLFLLLSLGFFLTRNTKPPQQPALTTNTTHQHTIAHALKCVLANPKTWLNGLFIGLLFGPTAAFAEQWGVSFLYHSNHLPHTVAAFDIGLVFIGIAIGCPLFGYLTNVTQAHVKLMRYSAIISLFLLATVIYSHHFFHLPNTVIALLLLAYGVANSGIVPSYALAAKINPHALTGLAIGFTNMASILIGSIFIPIIGYLLEYFWQGKMLHKIPIYSSTTYILALTILPASLLFAYMVSFALKDKPAS